MNLYAVWTVVCYYSQLFMIWSQGFKGTTPHQTLNRLFYQVNYGKTTRKITRKSLKVVKAIWDFHLNKLLEVATLMKSLQALTDCSLLCDSLRPFARFQYFLCWTSGDKQRRGELGHNLRQALDKRWCHCHMQTARLSACSGRCPHGWL